MSKALQIGVVVVAAAAAAYLILTTLTGRSHAETLDYNHYFICGDPGCGEEFAVDRDEWTGKYKLMVELSVPCPKCGAGTSVEGYKCPECGRLHPVVGHGQSQPQCPHCGADLTKSWSERKE